jgi:uncharacterized SAM-binding protein YcdF (DUF218 family)
VLLIARSLSALKVIGPPGSIGFLALMVAIGLGLMYVWPRNRRFGRRWLLGVGMFYVVLSIPLVANGIASLLPPIENQDVRPGSIDTLIVLDGDNLQGRVDQAARIYKKAAPLNVRVMGDWWTAKSIVESGVPPDKVRRVPNSGTTREQIAILKELLVRQQLGRTAVLASRFQAPRIEGLVRKRDLEVRVLEAPADDEPVDRGVRRVVPALGALWVSRDALYEHFALAYYRWRRWI